MTVIEIVDPHTARLKVGEFMSLSEALDNERQSFCRPVSWVQEKMRATEILDG